jgi:L-aspartate oxidase
MNKRGEYFMARYNKEQKDLAPRDEVARAIYQEMDDTGSNYVFLDARTMEPGIDVAVRFPHIYKTCLELGMDMKKEPIPVVPAAHYFCGGIKIDLSGRTNIAGLYSVGECSCSGIHGANRLASVSLLESLYFGLAAGLDASRPEAILDQKCFESIPNWEYPVKEEIFDKALIQHDMMNIQYTMWNYAGIVRTEKRLKRAFNDLNYMSHRIESFYKQARLTRDLVELRNSVFAASLIVQAANSNKTSLGCHYRAENPR